VSITPTDKITVPGLLAMKSRGEKITMITCYEATFARLMDDSGIDTVLVGDSMGMVVQGLPNTLSVTLDQMVYHCRSVARCMSRPLLIGDLPFGSYQVSPQQALESSIRLVKEGRVEVVKLEGGVHMAETIEAIARVDIPVMGHIGLTPQSYHRMGGHKVQGRKKAAGGDDGDGPAAPGSRERVIEDALAVQAAGAMGMVLEGIPLDLAREITAMVSIPTIGIGAGPHCDGQVLVLHDVLGLSDLSLRFTKKYGDLRTAAIDAMQAYAAEVREGQFPDTDHAYK
jgi:3-methyl-2-oxobutanoate hydroxymethyltransferase